MKILFNSNKFKCNIFFIKSKQPTLDIKIEITYPDDFNKVF